MLVVVVGRAEVVVEVPLDMLVVVISGVVVDELAVLLTVLVSVVLAEVEVLVVAVVLEVVVLVVEVIDEHMLTSFAAMVTATAVS